jgi:hypothetical protein
VVDRLKVSGGQGQLAELAAASEVEGWRLTMEALIKMMCF